MPDRHMRVGLSHSWTKCRSSPRTIKNQCARHDAMEASRPLTVGHRSRWSASTACELPSVGTTDHIFTSFNKALLFVSWPERGTPPNPHQLKRHTSVCGRNPTKSLNECPAHMHTSVHSGHAVMQNKQKTIGKPSAIESLALN